MLAVESAARAARARAGPSQLVMPLFSNAGFMPYLRNLLCSLQRLDVDNWFVIALDNETCPLLGATEGHCVQPYRDGGGGGSGAGSNGGGGGGGRSGVGRTVQSYGSFGFYWIAMQRPLWLYWLLGRGHSVINCDLDIVWLRDPRPHLSQPGHASADMLFQPDTGHGVNGGFYVALTLTLTLTLTLSLTLTLILTLTLTRRLLRCAPHATRARALRGVAGRPRLEGHGAQGVRGAALAQSRAARQRHTAATGHARARRAALSKRQALVGVVPWEQSGRVPHPLQLGQEQQEGPSAPRQPLVS